MKQVPLKEFFQQVNYDWEKDIDFFKDVCSLSKTRARPVSIKDAFEDSPQEFEFTWGMEQPFIMKAFIESLEGKINYFEIGTGRGTSSMAAAGSKNINKIDSFDILEPKHKRKNVVNFKEVQASNVDILKEFESKYSNKLKSNDREGTTMGIKLHHVSEYASFINDENNRDYDVCFIDGEHENPEIILKDYLICNKVMEKSNHAYIIWDDYYPDKMNVKHVVERVVEVDKRESYLVPFRGHLFGSKNRPIEKDAGVVIMKLK